MLDTEFSVADGVARLTDFMPLPTGDGSALMRRLEGVAGEVTLALTLRPRFGFGEVSPWWVATNAVWKGVVGPDLLALSGPPVERHGAELHARVTLRAGDVACFVLQHQASYQDLPTPLDPELALATTTASWEDWIAPFDRPSVDSLPLARTF